MFPLLPKVCKCSMCGNNVLFMLPTGTKSEVFNELKIVGGGYRKAVFLFNQTTDKQLSDHLKYKESHNLLKIDFNKILF